MKGTKLKWKRIRALTHSPIDIIAKGNIVLGFKLKIHLTKGTHQKLRKGKITPGQVLIQVKLKLRMFTMRRWSFMMTNLKVIIFSYTHT